MTIIWCDCLARGTSSQRGREIVYYTRESYNWFSENKTRLWRHRTRFTKITRRNSHCFPGAIEKLNGSLLWIKLKIWLGIAGNMDYMKGFYDLIISLCKSYSDHPDFILFFVKIVFFVIYCNISKGILQQWSRKSRKIGGV